MLQRKNHLLADLHASKTKSSTIDIIKEFKRICSFQAFKLKYLVKVSVSLSTP